MQRITEQVTDAVDQLALDEALLLAAENQEGGEALRVWEFSETNVIVGRSSKVEVEVDQQYCRSRGIAILRRCSGGASIVGGPGCLMYTVVLSIERQPDLQKIDAAHQFVMQRVLAAIRNQLSEVAFQGTCDLTWNDRKCSGNSLKISRSHLLYHGTILYRADLDQLARCLQVAPRQPSYRDGREHREFVTNISIDPIQFAADLADKFQASVDPAFVLPRSRMQDLRRQRYDDPRWHFRH